MDFLNFYKKSFLFPITIRQYEIILTIRIPMLDEKKYMQLSISHLNIGVK